MEKFRQEAIKDKDRLRDLEKQLQDARNNGGPLEIVLHHFQPPHLPGLCQARALLCGPHRSWARVPPFWTQKRQQVPKC